MAVKFLVGRVSFVRSKTMSAIKPCGTEPERIMRAHLSALGLRYRLNKKGLPGRPDIVFVKTKVAVFCDGDFWHGRNWKKRLANGQFKVRKLYWVNKIQENIARDRRNNRQLKKLGWHVLRFWGSQIPGQAEYFALKVKETVDSRSS